MIQSELLHSEKQRIVKIHFDGGTPCNIPRIGYGIGYGSFRLDDGEVIRVDHGIPCSNNAAETLTLCCALEVALAAGATGVIIEGDSQIVIRRVNARNGKKKKKVSGSEAFRESLEKLSSLLSKFESVRAIWLPRRYAVAAFGH